MIKLEIEEYCQNCPDFVPDTDKEFKAYFTDDYDGIPPGRKLRRLCKTTIRCKYRKRCDELVDTYLRYELKGGEQDA